MMDDDPISKHAIKEMNEEAFQVDLKSSLVVCVFYISSIVLMQYGTRSGLVLPPSPYSRDLASV